MTANSQADKVDNAFNFQLGLLSIRKATTPINVPVANIRDTLSAFFLAPIDRLDQSIGQNPFSGTIDRIDWFRLNDRSGRAE